MADLYSIDRREARTPNGSVSFLEAGKGTPLVLLHGIGSAAQSWREQFAYFSKRYRVIAWDAPGYGASSALESDHPDVSDYARRLHEFLQAVAADRCHLAGHSLGSLIAARFALLYPQNIRSLTLASCAIGHSGLPEAERVRLLESRIGDVRELGPRGMAQKRGRRLVTADAPEALVQQVIDTMAQVDPHGYAQAAHMLSQGNMIEDIRALPPSMPLHFVFGDQDVITPPEVNRRAAAARPGAPVDVIAGAGHAVYLEQADAFNRSLECFLEQGDG